MSFPHIYVGRRFGGAPARREQEAIDIRKKIRTFAAPGDHEVGEAQAFFVAAIRATAHEMVTNPGSFRLRPDPPPLRVKLNRPLNS